MSSIISNLSSLEIRDRFAEASVYTQDAAQRSVMLAMGLPEEASPLALSLGSLMSAGVGVLAAGLTLVSPLGGAILGAASFVTGYAANQSGVFNRAVDWICEKFNCDPESIVAKVVKVAAPIITGLLAGLALALATGFSIGSAAGLLLGAVAVLGTVITVTGAGTFAEGLFKSIRDKISELNEAPQSV